MQNVCYHKDPINFQYKRMERYENVNRKVSKKWCSCDGRVQWKDMPDRSLFTNVPDKEVVNNKIETTHSNFITFVPINLLTQLAKPANGTTLHTQSTS